MTAWKAVVLVTEFKGYVIEVYERMDAEASWGVRIFDRSYARVHCAELKRDGCTQLRAKKLGRKLVLKHRKLFRKNKDTA